MVRWHHQLNGHAFEQTLGDSEGQGSLACCSQWDCKDWDTIQGLNSNNQKFAMKQKLKQNYSLKYKYVSTTKAC